MHSSAPYLSVGGVNPITDRILLGSSTRRNAQNTPSRDKHTSFLLLSTNVIFFFVTGSMKGDVACVYRWGGWWWVGGHGVVRHNIVFQGVKETRPTTAHLTEIPCQQ